MTRLARVFGVTIVVLLIVGGIAFSSYRRQARELNASTLDDLAAICQLKVDFVTQWRDTLFKDAELLKTTPALVEYVSSPSGTSNEHLREVLDWVRPNFKGRGYTSIEIIGPGSDIASYRAITPLVEAARRGGVSQISPLYFDASDQLRIAVVSPIMTTKSLPTSNVVVLIADPAATLFPEIRQWPSTSASGETLLVKRDGNDVLFLNELRHQPGRALQLRRPLSPDLPAARALLDAPIVPDMVMRDYRQKDVVASWARIPGSDWAIVAKIDANEVFAPLNSLALANWLVIAAAAAIGVVISLWQLERREHSLLRQSAKTDVAEDRLSMGMRVGEIGLWDWDANLQTVYFSPEYKRQLGYADDEMESSFAAWQRLLHPDDRDRAVSALQRYAANPWPNFCEEFRIQHRSGEYRNMLTRAEGKFVDGRLVRMIGCNVDITPIKTLEAQYRHAQKMEAVGRLAGGVAHDFNNLLTVINGYVEFLLEDHRDGQLANDLREIQRAGKSAERLARQLLVFSRTSQQKVSQTDVNQLLTEWQRLLGRTLGDDVTVQLDLCDDRTVVNLGDDQIEQVLMNLAVNARDAMPSGGTLVLGTDTRRVREHEHVCTGDLKPGDYVVVSVKDSGTGIPAEILPQIFEPFFTTKESSKGTGLGLATVHGIMAGCGGGVCVKTSPAGTTFSLYFPRVAVGVRPGASALPSHSHTTSPCSVLVVDDDAAVREVFAREVGSAGHRVEAGDVNHAFALMKAGRRFDILVTDVVMPQIGGIELSQMLRAKLPQLRTIFITGYADSDLTAFPADAVVLAKPMARTALHSALEAAATRTPPSADYVHAI